jgi:hypothetical protein
MNKHTILDPRFKDRRWPAPSHVMLKLLGIETGRLPLEGMPSREIQGVQVWVTPIGEMPANRRKRNAHRLMCACPDCGKVLSVGRLHQHKCSEIALAITERARPVMPTKSRAKPKAPKKGFVIVHESADEEELERSAQFLGEHEGQDMAIRFLQTINFFPGDVLRCVDLSKKENGA